MIRTFLIHMVLVCYLHSCFGIGDIHDDSVCNAGQYGLGCQYNCSSSCDFDKCRLSPDKGVPECNKGCKIYHTGFFCQEFCPSLCLECSQLDGTCQKCVDGFYGQTCNQTCDRDCLNGTCHIIHGVCILASDTGGHNARVKRAKDEGLCRNMTEDGRVCQCCTTGRRGDNCEHICQNCQTFYIPNNLCEYQCKTGYYGNTCDKECSENCQPGNSGKPLCKATSDGFHCINGCKKGYTGRPCKESCSENCKNARCYQKDGKCVDCPNGKYGEMCNQNCNEGCKNNTCNTVDGKCVHGCKPGYYGIRCDKKCSDGCQENICSSEDGKCLRGCKIGYYREDCTATCGDNCTKNKCKDHFDSAKPNVTFLCSEGCKSGYKGRSCDQMCPKHCLICKQLSVDGCDQCDDGYKQNKGVDGQSTCFEAIPALAMSHVISITIVISVVCTTVFCIIITLIYKLLKRRRPYHPSSVRFRTENLGEVNNREQELQMRNLETNDVMLSIHDGESNEPVTKRERGQIHSPEEHTAEEGEVQRLIQTHGEDADSVEPGEGQDLLEQKEKYQDVVPELKVTDKINRKGTA